MILFFSATGNCKYVAARLAQATGQEILSIVDCIRSDRHTFQDETIGIVSPCYFWGLPSIVREFLEGAHFQADYLYFVVTYGTTPGAAGYMADRSIRGHVIDALLRPDGGYMDAGLRSFHAEEGGSVYRDHGSGHR